MSLREAVWGLAKFFEHADPHKMWEFKDRIADFENGSDEMKKCMREYIAKSIRQEIITRIVDQSTTGLSELTLEHDYGLGNKYAWPMIIAIISTDLDIHVVRVRKKPDGPFTLKFDWNKEPERNNPYTDMAYNMWGDLDDCTSGD